jgi:hypothetical protein
LSERALLEETGAPRLGSIGAQSGAHTGAHIEVAPREPEEDGRAKPERPAADPLRVAIASTLGALGASWMLAGPFTGLFPRLVAVGASLGAGLCVALSTKSKRPGLLQVLVLPLAIVAAVIAVVAAGAEPGRIVDLVVEALRQGGLSSPPVAFDPGWRVLIIAVSASLTAAAGTSAVVFDRPKLGVAMAGAVAAVATMFQPPGAEIVNIVVAMVAMIAALSVAYGAELARDGVTGTAFETRRMIRSGGIAVVLIAAMLGLARLGALLPDSTAEQVVPPKRPQVPPAPRDRVLLSIATTDRQIPLRTGVLDVYQDDAWMTPPFDPARLVDVGGANNGLAVATARTVEATVTLQDLEGSVVPMLPAATRIAGLGHLTVDPRTQVVRADGRQPRGTSYKITAGAPPTGAELARASATVDPSLAAFRTIPPPGPVVAQLVAQARAKSASPYEQLQFARTYYYQRVIAAGRGDPVDVPPSRVEQMLQEAEASPYEIVAGEALLARWLGIPARIGFGYYGGELNGKVVEVRPRNGAMWIEVYLAPHGWVPLVGRPPRAKASLGDEQKNNDPSVKPTDEIAAQVFIPTLNRTLSPAYVLVRYWLSRILPFVLAIVALIGGYPALLKRLRRRRRRRWANARGARARIAVAYAELRDVANDLNVGHPTQTPIEFLDAIEPDPEHRETAWIVTRTMWGDLRRGVSDLDASAMEETTASVRKRLAGGQPYLMRVLAAISRESLRQPFDDDMPNLWWRSRREAAQPAAHGRRARRMRRKLMPKRLFRNGMPRPRLRVLVPAATAALMLAAIAATGGVEQVDLTSAVSVALPSVPAAVDGYDFDAFDAHAAFDSYGTDSLVTGGRFFGIRSHGVVVGSFEQAAFKPGPRARGDKLRLGVLDSLRIHVDDVVRLSGERVYQRRAAEQTTYLWLADDLSSFQLLIATREIADPASLFARLLAAQRGETIERGVRIVDAPPDDPRRGAP